MKILHTVKELKQAAAASRALGKTVGLVPTMGALHRGHMSLMRRARQRNDVVIASVFVNPTQFNNADDLHTYPRDPEADAAMLAEAGVDFAFMPTIEEVYPEPDTRQFDLGPVAAVMEGPRRPGHFNGVAQIVSKLFEWVLPTRAYFGEKDFQQIAVIRRMVELCGGFDGLEIVSCPIVREIDGLALSSRNVRLTPEMRALAPQIHKILDESRQYAKTHTVSQTIDNVVGRLNGVHPDVQVEYYSIVDPATMQPVMAWPAPGKSVQGCITVNFGDVRLIDNIKY